MKHRNVGRWLGLGCGVLLTALASLFVHDFALTYLHVPYPKIEGLPHWVEIANLCLRGVGLVAFFRYSRKALDRLSPVAAFGLVSAIALALNETARLVIIDTTLARHGWRGGYWVLAIVLMLPGIVQAAALGVGSLWLARHAKPPITRLAGVVVVAFLIRAVALPAASGASTSLARHLGFFDANQEYFAPYSAGIYAVIYGTFVEPVIACFALAAMAWEHLPGRRLRKTALFTGLLLLTSGKACLFLLESPWVKQPFPLDYAATSQFLVEWLTAGVLTSLIWMRWFAARNHPNA